MVRIIAAVLIFCFLTVARALAAPGPSTELTLTLQAAQSGPTAFLGTPLIEGTRLAVDEINAAGGIGGRKVHLDILDDQNDVTTAVKNARTLTDGSTLAVLGHRTSDTGLEAGKIYAQAGICAITATAGAPAVTRGNPWYFRVIADNDAQGRFLVEYGRQVLGARSVRILADDSPYGRSLADAFEKACKDQGVTIESRQTVGEHASDLDAKVDEAVKACTTAGSGSLVLMASGEDVGWRYLKRLRDAGDRSQVLTGAAMSGPNLQKHFVELPHEKEQPGFYLDGVMGAAAALRDIAGEKAQRFYRRFREIYGHDADAAAAASYDAAMLAMRGLAEIGASGAADDRKKLRDWLDGLRSGQSAFAGITGKIFFDADHNAVKSFPVGRFTAGRFLAAPTQLELVANPARVPNFDAEVAAGNVIKSGDRYLALVQVVYVGIDVIGVSDVNQRSGEFTADMFVWFRYRGKLPTDELDFVNASKPIVLGEPLWTRPRGDMTISTWRVRATFSTPLLYARYPFDHQKLTVSLRPRTRTLTTFILASDVTGMSIRDRDFDALAVDKLQGSFAASTWRPVNAVSYQTIFRSDSTLGESDLPYAETGLEYSQINASVEIRRDVASFLLKNVLPLALIMLILYMSNFVPNDQITPRVNIGVTALLTSVVLYQRLSGDLPNIGYLVLMDYFFFVVFALCILQTAVSVAEFVTLKRQSPRLLRALHWIGLTLIPLGLLISFAVLMHYAGG